MFPHLNPPARTVISWRVITILLLVIGWFAVSNHGSSALAQEASEQTKLTATTHGESDSVVTPHDEEHEAGGHSSLVAPLLLALILILFFAKVSGDLFERIGFPAVLGELSVGILLGNIAFLSGWHGLEFLKAPPEGILSDPYSPGAALKMLAEIGVVLLLFEVGLESTVGGMMKVGASSFVVAILGVIVPILLGVGLGWGLLHDHPWQVWLFLGATLCATSVGITARVLKDIGRSQQRESQIILGAAVIDDVLGLIVLAVVSGIIQKGADFDTMSLIWIVVYAVGFLFGAILLGNQLFTKPLFKMASFQHGHGLLVTTALVICFGFAYLANLVGLAPIVGAFAAGLILERVHYKDLATKENVELEDAIRPLTALLVPIFFVQMGIMVDLQSFTDPSVWLLAGAITVAAILGKQVCALGVLEKGLDRLSVGFGMIPRGEVGLIFAAVGASLVANGEKVVSPEVYSAIVVMVIITTMVTPPMLKWSMNRKASPPPESST